MHLNKHRSKQNDEKRNKILIIICYNEINAMRGIMTMVIPSRSITHAHIIQSVVVYIYIYMYGHLWHSGRRADRAPDDVLKTTTRQMNGMEWTVATIHIMCDFMSRYI